MVVIDQSAAGGRALTLDEEHQPTRVRRKIFLVGRIGVEQYGARSHGARAALEVALQYVPDLGEVMAVAVVMRTGFVSQESGIRMDRVFRCRLDGHVRVLAREAKRLPGHLVLMNMDWTVVLQLGLKHGAAPSSVCDLGANLALRATLR